MKTTTKIAIALGTVAAALVGAGVYEHHKSNASASSAPGYASPATLPPGPYRLISTGTSETTLLAGKTYLVSVPIPSSMTAQQAAQEAASEVAQGSLLGLWTGKAPAGWPAGDPNAANGVFVALTEPSTSSGDAIAASSRVYATAGETA